MPVKVAIIDSGLTPERAAAWGGRVAAAAGFMAVPGDGAGARMTPPVADPSGHGTQVAELVLAASPASRLLCAQVFCERRAISAAVVAAAIEWSLTQGARVINLSLGLREDYPSLRRACRQAHAAGALLVASAPARGGVVYPAAYPEVLAVTGDARCAAGGWSLIEGVALIGASPQGARLNALGGASYAAARVSGMAAAFFERAGQVAPPAALSAAFLATLQADAAFFGRERHRPEVAA
jgi:hypothetical protein